MATKAKPSTAVAVKASSNIVSIQEALKLQVAGMANRVAPPTGSTIRLTQDKQFSLPDGSKTPGPLELVVVEFTNKNVFYETAFDQKNPTPPACFAIGNDIKNMAPSKNSPVAQCIDCAGCPMNAFGSKGNGKACANTKLLAVLPPDADADTPLWLMNVSPTAGKGFDKFVGDAARIFQMPPVGVVVTVGFNPNETYAQLVFSDPKPNANVADHFARQDEARQMLAAEPDVSGFVAKPKGKLAGRR
jgi:hypothetical protein